MRPYIPWGKSYARHLAAFQGAAGALNRIAHIGSIVAEGLLYLSESANFFGGGSAADAVTYALSFASETRTNVKMEKPLTWRRPAGLLKLDSLHCFRFRFRLLSRFYAIRDCD